MSDNIIQLNEAAIKGELKDLVKNSVEETLNALLDHEADELVNAERYERSGDRKGYRSGHYDRNFTTTAGDVTLHVPKLKGVPFETAIIERYRRRETSIEEALIEMYLAGVFMLLVFYNCLVLRRPSVGDDSRSASLAEAVRSEVQVIDRIARKPYWLAVVSGLFFVLLPQSLMFHTRVLFLLASKAEGGLGCTMLQVGFAQGTIGVMAFSIALAIGHRLLMHRGVRRTYWLFAIPMGLSPWVYLLMTVVPPVSLLWLCVATFLAQFFFGLGLNLTVAFVRYISGDRYRNTINYLYIPMVALVMFVPMGISGWLLQRFGFQQFFIIDALCALLSWASAALGYSFLSNYQVPQRHASHPHRKHIIKNNKTQNVVEK